MHQNWNSKVKIIVLLEFKWFLFTHFPKMENESECKSKDVCLEMGKCARKTLQQSSIEVF